jgi:hypothetical protein
MVDEPGPHVFDDERARTYPPNPDFTKTAILVDLADESAITTINTRFGIQRMRGPFYVVAENTHSYGASRAEFEQSHIAVAPNRWMRSEPVLAYPADRRCTVETFVDGGREASTVAEPGDWIVRQPSGEVMVVAPTSFAERYLVDGADDGRTTSVRTHDDAGPGDVGAEQASG